MKSNKFRWFANDADGLSMIDVLTLLFTATYIIFKIVEVILVTKLTDPNTLNYLSLTIDNIDNLMYVIVTSYFIKKGIDTTVSKVCLTKENQYKETCYNNEENISKNENNINII